MNKYSLPNFYSILPSIVRYSKELTSLEKLIYSEITALTNALGYCYAHNSYFEMAFNVSERTVQRALKKLQDKNFINIEIIKDDNMAVLERKIYLNVAYTPGVKIVGTPHDKNDGIARDHVFMNNKGFNSLYKNDYSFRKNIKIDWLDDYIKSLDEEK